jgi:hypothetical protein
MRVVSFAVRLLSKKQSSAAAIGCVIKLLPLVLILALPAVVQAQFNYTTNNGTITITGYTGIGGTVIIPSTINGLPVTGIGDYAFYNSIGLGIVTIPDSVASIGDSAFCGCSSMTTITIGSGVTNIARGVFDWCTSLSSITVAASNPIFSSLFGVVFNKARTILIKCPWGKTGAFPILNTVTNIGKGAFYRCIGLTNVTIGNSVTSIGDGAFQYCVGLPSITIPNSVTTIGGSAFEACNLINVTMGTNVTSIGDWAFSECASLTNIAIPNSLTSIGWYAFSWCQHLSNFTIPSRTTYIGYRAFYYAWGLTAITVDPGNPVYSSVDGVLFTKNQTVLIQYPAGKVGSYRLPNGVTTIGDSSFADSVSLTTITVPRSVSSIETQAFMNCPSLVGVYCEGNAPTVASFVFDYAGNPTAYYLPGTTGWGSTFGGCPTALWFLPNPLILSSGPSFGVQTNGFGFTISWATNSSVVVEAATNPAKALWLSVSTNPLVGGSSYFSDPDWTKYPARFYRIRSP